MISFQHTCVQQPDQSGFVDTPGTSTSQSTTFTSRLSIVPYRLPLQPLLMISKRKNDLKRIHKENHRIEKWLKILPKYQTVLTKNPKKSTLIPLRPSLLTLYYSKEVCQKRNSRLASRKNLVLLSKYPGFSTHQKSLCKPELPFELSRIIFPRI